MKRRSVAIAGVAGLAAVAGGAVSWWRGRASAPDVWSLTFDDPQGRPLALAALRGRPLLINFWATWCAPCVRELPMLDRFQREHPRWQVVGLAIDGVEPVRRFLAERPVGFRVAMAQAGGVALSRELGNDQGGLPFSVVFDAKGRLAQRKLGALEASELSTWAKGVE